MNLKTTIAGILTFLFNAIATFGIVIDPQVQGLITSILIAVALYFAADKDAVKEKIEEECDT